MSNAALFDEHGNAMSAPQFQPPGINTPFEVTFFRDHQAKDKHQEPHSLFSLSDLIQDAAAGRKEDLPRLKLATFGKRRSAKGSLRWDDNVLSVTGIEADYDGEQVGSTKQSKLRSPQAFTV